jgi:hypothetical protein
MAKYSFWQKPKNRQIIFDFLTNGHNKSELIEFMEIDRSTFYQWLKEYEDFKQLITEAEEIRDDIICDKIEEKLEEKCFLFSGDFRAMTYFLEHKRPNKWGAVQEQTKKDDIPKFIDDIE